MTHRTILTIFFLFLTPGISCANPAKLDEPFWQKSPNPQMAWQVSCLRSFTYRGMKIDVEKTMMQEKSTAVGLFNCVDAFCSRNISTKDYVIDFDDILKMLLVFTDAKPKDVDIYDPISVFTPEWDHLEYTDAKNPSKTLEDIFFEHHASFKADGGPLKYYSEIIFIAPSYGSIKTDLNRYHDFQRKLYQLYPHSRLEIQGMPYFTNSL